MKKIIAAIVLLLLALILGLGIFNYLHISAKVIGEDEAKSIALADAGLAEKDVSFTKIKLERDDDGQQYEIEFSPKLDNEPYYKYEIDAVSGGIISTEARISQSPANSTETNAAITAEQAKAIALAAAGLKETDTSYITTSYENEHNGAHWKVEFSTQTHEYEYEINAADGSIIESEQDHH